MSRREAPAGPGEVKVRLLGDQPACRALAALLATSADVDVLSADGPYPNRREPGGRLYLTVRALAAEAVRPGARFDLGDADTYFVLTEALLDFASRERAAGEPRLAGLAATLLGQVDAAVPGADYGSCAAWCPECGAGSLFNGMSGGTPSWLCVACGHQWAGKPGPDAPAPASEDKRDPGGSHPPGPLAPIS